MAGPLKIAVWHYLPSGGGKRALFDQVKGLLQKGHHVEVWCPAESDSTFLPLSSLTKEHRIPLREVVVRGCCWGVATAWAQTRGIKKNLGALSVHCRACADEIDKGGFDVILAHSSKLFYTHPLARFTRTPSVIYLHEVFRGLYEARPRLVWEMFSRRGRGKRALRAWSGFLEDAVRTYGRRIQVREERLAAVDYQLILVNSLFSRESIVRTYGLDAHVCYLGIDTDHFKPDGRPKEDFILGVGGAFAPKGAHLAIEAMGLMPSSHRLRLCWVGNFADPVYLDNCKGLAKRLNVPFEFTEMAEEGRLLELFRRARLLIYPAVLEPFGYAPLEANACGTPAVGVAEGGLRETVQDGVNGFLSRDRNSARLADAMMRVLDNNSYDCLCQTARAHVQKAWSLQESIDRLESFLTSAAETRSHPNRSPCRDVFAVVE